MIFYIHLRKGKKHIEAGYGRKIVKPNLWHVPTNLRVKVVGVPQTTGQQLVQLKRVINLIFQDSEVETVVRLHGSPETSWGYLRYIFEVIQSDVGGLMVSQGWAAQPEIDTFTQTANSRQAIGDEARHGHKKNPCSQKTYNAARSKGPNCQNNEPVAPLQAVTASLSIFACPSHYVPHPQHHPRQGHGPVAPCLQNTPKTHRSLPCFRCWMKVRFLCSG